MAVIWDLVILLFVYFQLITGSVAHLSEPEVSMDCWRQGICEHVHNYPKELAENLTKEFASKNAVFTFEEEEPEEEDHTLSGHSGLYVETEMRSGLSGETEMFPAFSWDADWEYKEEDDSEMEHYPPTSRPDLTKTEKVLCQAEKKVTNPQSMPDEQDNWEYILNPNNDPIQTIDVELCSSTTEPKCNGEFQNGYEAVCQQKHYLKKLWYINRNTNRTEEKFFKIPSCCSCVLVDKMIPR